MNDFGLVYEAVKAIWGMRKRYGGESLNDDQWDALLKEAKEQSCRLRSKSEDVDLLFRDMFAALREYYSRKEVDR